MWVTSLAMWLVYTCQYNKAPNVFTLGAFGCGQSQDRTGDPTLFRRVLYRLSYLAKDCRKDNLATLTGLEPATSAVTGRRANQLRHRAILRWNYFRTPNGIRTRAAAVKGRCPRPLDDGGLSLLATYKNILEVDC